MKCCPYVLSAPSLYLVRIPHEAGEELYAHYFLVSVLTLFSHREINGGGVCSAAQNES